MKKLNKNNIKLIFSFILGIVFTTFGVFAATLITADQVSYKGKSLDQTLDVLYDRSSNLTKFCKKIEGTFGEVGSKYECDPGDGTKRNFYLLAKDTNKVKLIMEHNITEGSATTTMTWMNAMKYFRTGAGASTKAAWVNVQDVDLPMAQDIANAVGNTGWNMEDKNGGNGWFYFDKSNGSYGQTQVANASNLSNYRWLYNYTRECSANGCDSATSLGGAEAYGYWTRDIVAQQGDSNRRAWSVIRTGAIGYDVVSYSTAIGVRPVITVLKSNLYQ